MKKDGVCFLLESEVSGVEVRGNEKVVHYEMNGGRKKIAVDEILLGIGRAPNVEGLDLERAGVEYDTKEGVKVNSRLRTTNPRIFAAGDVCFPLKFTHAADVQARILIQNALFPHPFGLGYATTGPLVIPWCTYTQPELAHAGMYEAEAKARGIEVDTYTFKLEELDRAILDGEESGFARVHVRKGTDKILGATIVADRAGDLISEFTLAMRPERG
jgi:pyruvate/2-oxoglutarate dehydrogenase complex dihydrolipoamide dehydrogenase (E3) component